MRARTTLGIGLLTTAFALATAAPARAEVQITFHDGQVSLVAKDATLGQILTEWAKVGPTTIVNGERAPGGPLTLQLTDVPEAQALDILLRALSGYVAAPRATPVAGLSRFDRIVVMPTVAASVSGATSAAASFPQPIYPAAEPPAQDVRAMPLVREDFPADDEVNWNRGPESVPQPQLAAGAVPAPPDNPNPGMPTVPAGVGVPGMPTSAPLVPRPPTQTVPPEEEVR